MPRATFSRVRPIAQVATNPSLLPKRSRTWRSVAALVLREMTTTYGRSPGGYIWAVVEPLAVIALLSFAFSLAFQAPSLGTSFPLFYATGYLPYMLFHDVSSKTALAFRFSRPLLNFSAVTWLDVLLARYLLNLLTHISVGGLVIFGLVLLEDGQTWPNLALVFRAVVMAASLALAVGAMNALLFLAFPAWERVWMIVTRPLFIISGVFFLFEDVPSEIRNMLWLNPLFHVTGEMRRAVYPAYEASYVSPVFVFGIACALLAFSLLMLSRHANGMLHE